MMLLKQEQYILNDIFETRALSEKGNAVGFEPVILMEVSTCAWQRLNMI